MKSFEQWWQEQKQYDIEYTKPETVTPSPIGVPFLLECRVCEKDISDCDWVEEYYKELRAAGMSEDEAYHEMINDDVLCLCGGNPSCLP